MRRFKLLGLALVAVFASAAALSTSAFAAELPENLPTSSSTRNWTGASEGEAKFLTESSAGTLEVICKEATAEGTEEAGKPLGLYHIHFTGCHATISGTEVKCTDLNHSTAGEILTLGTWHLVFDRETGKEFKELTTAVLFLNEPVHFSCSALVLIEVKGEQLCLHLKATEKSTKHSFHCIASGPKQTEEWCKKDKAGVCTEPVAPKLESSINHAAFKSSAELALGNTKYTEEIFADV